MGSLSLQEKGDISNGILQFASGNYLATDIPLLNELKKLNPELENSFMISIKKILIEKLISLFIIYLINHMSKKKLQVNI